QRFLAGRGGGVAAGGWSTNLGVDGAVGGERRVVCLLLSCLSRGRAADAAAAVVAARKRPAADGPERLLDLRCCTRWRISGSDEPRGDDRDRRLHIRDRGDGHSRDAIP